jgi:PIN domain nuclease of toxin-antitoxin system
MRLLLDTHVLLWALAEPERLPVRVRQWLVSPENDVLFSAASI